MMDDINSNSDSSIEPDSDASKTQKNLIDLFLQSRSEEQLRYMYEQIQIMLSVDFIPKLPIEITDLIFSKLTAEELLNASLTSKLWYSHTMRDQLWQSLCKKRGWTLLGTDFDISGDEGYKTLYKKAYATSKKWKNGDHKNDGSWNLHYSRIESMDVSNFILTGCRQGILTVSRWTNQDLQPELKIETKSPINCVKIHNYYAISGHQDGSTRVYNSTTGTELSRYQLPRNLQVDFITISKRANKMVIFGHNHFQVVDLKDGKLKFESDISARAAEISAVDSAYHFVLFTMWNGEIKTLNMNSGKIKLLASENDEAVECCQIEPNSLRAVTGGADGTVQGWNIINGKSLFTGNTSNDIYCVATKNEKVASADCEGVIRLWTWTGQIIRVMKEHVGSIRTLHYHPFYEVLISGGDAKFLVLWDSESGDIIKRIIRNNQQIHIMKLTSNKMVISGPNNPGRLTVYSFNQHKDPDSKLSSS